MPSDKEHYQREDLASRDKSSGWTTSSQGSPRKKHIGFSSPGTSSTLSSVDDESIHSTDLSPHKIKKSKTQKKKRLNWFRRLKRKEKSTKLDFEQDKSHRQGQRSNEVANRETPLNAITPENEDLKYFDKVLIAIFSPIENLCVDILFPAESKN